MAVPSAVIRQREKLQAELGMNPDGTPIAATPPAPPELTVVPPAAPPQQTPTSPAPDTSALQSRIQELEHLLSTRDGQTSTSMREANDARQRADVLASQVQALEQSMAEMRTQLETAEARAQAKQVTLPNFDAVEDLTPAEREKFGDDSIGFVNKLTKAQLAGVVKPLLDKVTALEKMVDRVRELDKLPQLEKSVRDAETETQRVREEEFFRKEVLAYFPDFETKVRDTQGWRDYLTTDIPGRGIKNQHLLNHYRTVNNASGIRSVIQGYYDQVQARPSLAPLATPSGTKTEGTPVEKPRMKASEYKSKLRDFTQRRMTAKDWEAFKTDFNAAFAEGRVDMDERL